MTLDPWAYTALTMRSVPRVVRCPLLIGRDDLLELADRRLDDVVAGHGQFLLLAGEAGIGKTRFLGAIVRKAEARGFRGAGGPSRPRTTTSRRRRSSTWPGRWSASPAFADLGARAPRARRAPRLPSTSGAVDAS